MSYFKTKNGVLYQGDCMELLHATVRNGSVDMVLSICHTV